MLKKVGFLLSSLTPMLMTKKLICKDEDNTENIRDPIDTLLNNRPPSTPQEIRGHITQPDDEYFSRIMQK